MFDAIFRADPAALLAALRQLAAVALAGVAVKLLDDYLDREDAEDARALPAYALLALSASVVLAPGLASSLFLAAYAVGMLKDLGRPFPARLTGWQEVALVVAAGLLLTGWREMLESLALMVAVQSGDDLLDWSLDRARGRTTLIGRIGLGECVFLCVFTAALAWCLAPGKTALVAGTAAGIWWGERALRASGRGLPERVAGGGG